MTDSETLSVLPKRSFSRLMAICGLFAWILVAWAQNQLAADPSKLTPEEKEEFLRNGKIVSERTIPVGITQPQRVTLEYNGMRHDAHIQT